MEQTYFQRGAATAIISIIALVLIGIGVAYVISKRAPSQEATAPSVTDGAMMENDGLLEGQDMAMTEEDTMMEDSAVMPDSDASVTSYSGTVLAGTSAPLLDFNQADYAEALQSEKLIVLYFYASWCPDCIAEFPRMQSAFNGLATDQVIAFRVNYNDNQTDENEVALARQHGVAYQHTKVFVKGGQQILKSPETWNEARYVTEINKVLGQ